ncbi:MAG TPA: hypothetical protein VMW80_10285 [Candidatus Dormibacteraeota bacterium]|nr:hypothetical protein [Candidatus Dormibacteraeota bacterium]
MRRPRVYVRTPGCGCVGLTVPCLVALAVVLTVGYVVGIALFLL